jgi:Rrf2 family transcriptional regulator, nitric oxide-sensitive transcriptional repressor
MTTQQIAGRTKVPANYLSKVLQGLARAGVVHSQRGLNGGFTLNRPTATLTIWDVVHAVDAIKRIDTCPLGLEEHGKELCSLHRRLDEAMAMIEKVYRDTTVAELLSEENKSMPLCEMRQE